METLEAKRGRVRRIIQILRNAFPDSACRLTFESPYELLVKTILSAQCTDERVNVVGNELFKKYRGIQEVASAEISELESIIRPAGLFRNKARHIKACSSILIERFSGKVPDTMYLLQNLSGVGRKTANVILGNAYGIPAVVVDTHVIRISGLLKLTNHNDPVKIENDLKNVIPKKEWIQFSHIISDHGRSVCIAGRPQCGLCPIEAECPSSLIKPVRRQR
jgi:endonuclease-3